MKHVNYRDVEAEPVEIEGARGVRVRWLVSDHDGAPNFCMRRFELEPGGNTPRHAHPWEHEVYVLEGQGTVFYEGVEEPFTPGDVVYVPPNAEHSFIAYAGSSVAFLCLIPMSGRK